MARSLPTRMAALLLAVVIPLVTSPSQGTVNAASPRIVPKAELTSISALAVSIGQKPAYVATPSGLFQSIDPSYGHWEQMNHVPGITQISANPRVSGDLLYATDNGIFRSLDGGRTAIQTSGCKLGGLARAPSAPTVLYAATLAYKDCPFITPAFPAILRSTDDGRTWALAYRPSAYYDGGSSFGQVAVDPANSGHVIVAMFGGLGKYPQTRQTLGTGKPWVVGPLSHILYGSPSAIDFDPVHQHNLWIAWAFGCPAELDRNSVAVAADLFTSRAPYGLAFDPVSGRLYVGVLPCQAGVLTQDTEIYTVDGATDTYLAVGSTIPSRGGPDLDLAVTGNGYLLAGGPQAPLTVLKLNGPGIWGRASFLSSSARLLGSPISPPTVCHGSPCQYFEKGALGSSGAPLPLVTALLTASPAASLPVGGTTSTITYGGLAKLESKRTPLPAGFRHGILVSPTGTFVPFSAHLTTAPGEIVPSAFWRFLTNPHSVPGGWLHDIGLPVTPAVQATVIKGSLGTRAITIQAFQYAVLTDDPRNPPATQVERANIGSDYAAVFPAATR